MKRTALIHLRGKNSRTVVAAAIGITPQMLGAIERGDRTPSLELAKRIADYFETSIEVIFFTEKGNKPCLKSG